MAALSPALESWLSTLPRQTVYLKRSLSADKQEVTQKLEQSKTKGSRVTVKCPGGDDIDCDEQILANNSRVFYAMIHSDFKEAHEKTIEVNDVLCDVVHKIIRFLHGDQLELDGATVMEYLRFADMYEIEALCDVCAQFLIAHVSVDVVINLWDSALCFNVPSMAEQCRVFASNHLEALVKTPNFSESSLEQIIEILAAPGLEIPHEYDVFNIIMAWALHKDTERADNLKQLFGKCLRVENLSATDVHTFMETKEFDNFSDVTKIALLSLLHDISGLRLQRELLPPRMNTTTIDCLRVCLNDRKKCVTISLVNGDGGLQEATHDLLDFFNATVLTQVFDLGSYIFVYSVNSGLVYYTYLSQVNRPKMSSFDILHDILLLRNGELVSVHYLGDEKIVIKRDRNVEQRAEHFRPNAFLDIDPDCSLATHSYGDYVMCFSISESAVKIDVLSDDHVWKRHYDMALETGEFCCSTVKENVACFVCENVMFLLFMDEVVRCLSSSQCPDCVDGTHDFTLEIAQPPVTSDDGLLVSAAIYGHKLYVTETPIKNNQLKLHVTDFNELMNSKDDVPTHWSSQLIDISQSVRERFDEGVNERAADLAVQLTSTRIRKREEHPQV